MLEFEINSTIIYVIITYNIIQKLCIIVYFIVHYASADQFIHSCTLLFNSVQKQLIFLILNIYINIKIYIYIYIKTKTSSVP